MKIEPLGGGRFRVVSHYIKPLIALIRRLPCYQYKGGQEGVFEISTPDEARQAIKVFARSAKYGLVPRADLKDHIKMVLENARRHLDAIRSIALRHAEDGRALMAHQVDGITWLAMRRRGLLADEQGLGKTLQAIMAVPPKARCIVVCPAHLRDNWRREIARWRPELAPRTDILSYRGAVSAAPSITGPTVLILDEVHYCKNYKAKRTIAAKALADKVLNAGGRVYGLTGTPLLNRPPELFSVLSTIGLAWSTFDNWTTFASLFGRTVDMFTGATIWRGPTKRKLDEVHRRLSGAMIRREKRDVLDLPDKVRSFIPVSVDRAEIEYATKALGEFASMGDLRSADFFEISRIRKMIAMAKFPRLLEFVEDMEASGCRPVVMSAHKDPVKLLGERPGWVAITGETSMKDRDAIVDNFQRGHFRGLAATIKAAGTGLTLTSTDTMIFLDLLWTPGENEQAEDRIHRIGSRGAFYYYLVSDTTIDRLVADHLERKLGLVKRTITPTASVVSFDQEYEEIRKLYKAMRQEVRRVLSSGVLHECPACGTFLTWRTASDRSTRPGEKYARCDCGYFTWKDSAQ